VGEENEDLIRYAGSLLEKEKIDYFIFGHRHLEMICKLRQDVEIVFLGDWIKNGSYAEWDGNTLAFKLLD
jgi:UDP-2,3-diacylglucosamine hydrolase